MIKGMEHITIDSAQDTLCIILEEIISIGRPSDKSMAQAEYSQEQLTKIIPNVDNDTAHNISNLLNTINKVLNTFNNNNTIIRTAKPFGKYNSHIILPGNLEGENVLITLLPEGEQK